MNRRFNVDYMARVEGETALDVTVSDGSISDLNLRVFEPSRFFEGFLVGRTYSDAPDLTARICGICPVSHMLASIEAIEDAFEIIPTPDIARMRELLALSQWIQSHTLHIYMLALPDYLGYASALEMAEDYREVVENALALKRLGNDLTVLIGGREVHPVTPIVGGFTNFPSAKDIADITARFKEAVKDARVLLDLVAGLDIPQFTRKSEYISIASENDKYPLMGNSLISNNGRKFNKREYRNNIIEEHVSHSNALFSSINNNSSFMVGPLARVNLNYGKLNEEASRAAEENTFSFPSYNPFDSIKARALELMHGLEECVELLGSLEGYSYQLPVVPHRGSGVGIKEAPRGLNYHYYEIDEKGIIEKADIVSPTAHNVYNMEEDLRKYIPKILDLSDEEITKRCEMLIRSYDPCFSCSAHFLKVTWKGRG